MGAAAEKGAAAFFPGREQRRVRWVWEELCVGEGGGQEDKMGFFNFYYFLSKVRRQNSCHTRELNFSVPKHAGNYWISPRQKSKPNNLCVIRQKKI